MQWRITEIVARCLDSLLLATGGTSEQWAGTRRNSTGSNQQESVMPAEKKLKLPQALADTTLFNEPQQKDAVPSPRTADAGVKRSSDWSLPPLTRQNQKASS